MVCNAGDKEPTQSSRDEDREPGGNEWRFRDGLCACVRARVHVCVCVHVRVQECHETSERLLSITQN